MNKLICSVLACASFFPLTGHSTPLGDDYSLSGSLGVYSEYRSRGLSQTLGDPAAQATATLLHNDTGLYAGAWTSNVDFGYDLKTRQELDYYAGWFYPINDNVSLDTGYVKYTYPKESRLNMSEWYSMLTVYGFKAALYYSSDAAIGGREEQSTLYSYVGYAAQLPYETGLEVRYGVNDYKDSVWVDNSGSGRDSYREWEVRLTRTMLGLEWTASYVDTDLSKAECLDYSGFDDLCSATLVVGASKKF
ncbi:TorF family putative porin [Pseudomonas sp. BJa5]|uniref:TorF family putative porin n=1 Tax=Pseudomonas sp. BJa5 TaxID=2936270 RepID=UPI002559BF65|nr:TorF family putative porin [Pseudomonas sp. BGr12]MDL2423668.1 TorF family putative porin [Pseudomonas sp. BGr12]